MTDLSIVVASAGDLKRITDLVSNLEKQFFNNFELVVCVPFECLENLKKNIFKPSFNLKFVGSNFRNQVVQRAIGFSHASSELLYQIDDDIWIEDSNHLSELLEISKYHGPKSILVTPVYDFNGNRGSRSVKILNNSVVNFLIKNVFNNGKPIKPYSVLDCGYAVGNIDGSGVYNSWCGSHFAFNKTALPDYSPFLVNGKAFYEDVHTSYNFTKNGYKLINTNLKVMHPPMPSISYCEYLHVVENHRLLVSLNNLSRASSELFLFLARIVKRFK